MAWVTPFVSPSQKTQSMSWSPAGLLIPRPSPPLRQSVLVQAETLTSWDLLHITVICAFKPGVRGVTTGSTPQEYNVKSP